MQKMVLGALVRKHMEKVTIADDDKHIIDQILPAVDANEAYTIIVLDLNSKLVDGFEVCKKIL